MAHDFVSAQCPNCDEWTTYDRTSYQWTTDTGHDEMQHDDMPDDATTSVECPFCEASFTLTWAGETDDV